MAGNNIVVILRPIKRDFRLMGVGGGGRFAVLLYRSPVLPTSKLAMVLVILLLFASGCASEGGDSTAVVQPEPVLTAQATTVAQPTEPQAAPAPTPTTGSATPTATSVVEPAPTPTTAVPDPTIRPAEPAAPEPTPIEVTPEPAPIEVTPEPTPIEVTPELAPTGEQSVAEEVYEECIAPDFSSDEELDTELDEMLAADGIYEPEEPSALSASECQRLAECVADLGMSIEELEQAAEEAESLREMFDPVAHCYPPRWSAYFNELLDYLEEFVEFFFSAEEDPE
jgi:hypothetical protein